MQDLVGWGKETEFYVEESGKLLKDFKWGSVVNDQIRC